MIVGDVHCRHEYRPFVDASLADGVLNFVGDADSVAVVRGVEPEILGVELHAFAGCNCGAGTKAAPAANNAMNAQSPTSVPRRNGSAAA